MDRAAVGLIEKKSDPASATVVKMSPNVDSPWMRRIGPRREPTSKYREVQAEIFLGILPKLESCGTFKMLTRFPGESGIDMRNDPLRADPKRGSSMLGAGDTAGVARVGFIFDDAGPAEVP